MKKKGKIKNLLNFLIIYNGSELSLISGMVAVSPSHHTYPFHFEVHNIVVYELLIFSITCCRSIYYYYRLITCHPPVPHYTATITTYNKYPNFHVFMYL